MAYQREDYLMEFERPARRRDQINVRVTETERVSAERAAAKAGVSVAELVRAALREATAEVLAER
jgi:predicted HicB family RNase H-like nuclease